MTTVTPLTSSELVRQIQEEKVLIRQWREAALSDGWTEKALKGSGYQLERDGVVVHLFPSQGTGVITWHRREKAALGIPITQRYDYPGLISLVNERIRMHHPTIGVRDSIGHSHSRLRQAS